MSTFTGCLDRTIVTAYSLPISALPYKSAFVASYTGYSGGIIHITGFKIDPKTGEEYAEYYLPSSATRGRRYLYKLAHFAVEDEDLDAINDDSAYAHMDDRLYDDDSYSDDEIDSTYNYRTQIDVGGVGVRWGDM
jgi:hypothetical protein